MQPRTYTKGAIPKHVAHLSAVMIWGFLAMTLGQLIEIVYVGQLGTEAVAALTFMFPISMTLKRLLAALELERLVWSLNPWARPKKTVCAASSAIAIY